MTKFSTKQYEVCGMSTDDTLAYVAKGFAVVHVEYAKVETLSQNYGIFDAKGREIGGTVEITTETWVDGQSKTQYWATVAKPEIIGQVVYSVRPHATRNGKNYGASQPSVEYTTLAEAKAHAASYFFNACTRARKTKGNTAKVAA